MNRKGRHNLAIDARPRGAEGPLAEAIVRGRPVLVHLVDWRANCRPTG